jgi:hypothetical protein
MAGLFPVTELRLSDVFSPPSHLLVKLFCVILNSRSNDGFKFFIKLREYLCIHHSREISPRFHYVSFSLSYLLKIFRVTS